MSTIDVLNLIAPSQQFMATSYLLPAPGNGSNPSITYLSAPDDEGNQQLVYMKGWAKDANGKPTLNPDGSYQGQPWDWLTATTYTDPVTGVKSGWIRQRLTENVWADPKSGKLCFGLGVRRLPRYVTVDNAGDMVNVQWAMTSPETDYLIFGASGATVVRNTNANVRCTFRGPYTGAAITDGAGKVLLPAGTDWCEDYERGGNNTSGVMIYGAKEVVTHRTGIGRYQWQQFASDGNGGYAVTPSSQSLQAVITPLPTAVGVRPRQGIF